ncbi:peptidase M48-like protein [Lentzea atacamensis]|uniref:Peptidase M48-like protein n=2 Tax=Pseudonocardiaceae TaxID=2070 RepID=A0A316IFW4_9PSEU|nr:peptidase M48-like protein [Lentzea atacamensis]
MTEPKPQVSPRALPSEMILLLLLLAVTVLLNVLFVANWLSGLERGGAGTFLQKLQMLLTPGLAVYGIYAAIRIRRSTRLSETGLREADKAVADLVLEVNPPRRVDVRLGKRLGGRAYVTGPPRKPIIVLGPELLALHAMPGQRKAVFDAVVRHELAHVHAGDLWWYQLATVLRMANLSTAFFALLVLWLDVLLDRGDITSFLVSTLRLAALTLLTELIARAFLRAREHAADQHAAEFGVEGLLAAVQAHQTEQTRSVVRTWLRRHPGADERSQALTNPMRLLASPIGQVLLGGAAAGAAFVTLQDLLLSGSTDDRATPIITGVVIGIPLTLFAAFYLWRASWQEDRNRLRPLLTAAALLAGLVIGSHLPLYTRIFDQAPIGIPIAPSVLLVFALGTSGLCWWLDALSTSWRKSDPSASRMPVFLRFAVPSACLAGGWLFAVLWTWSARLRGVHLACPLEEAKSTPICQSSTPQSDIALKVAADFGFTFWSILTLLVIAATLVVPHHLRTRTLRPAAFASAAVLVVLAALWTTRSTAPLNRARAEFRPVLETATADASDCTKPLTDNTLPLVRCSADGSERLTLGPAAMSTVDIADAAAEQTTTGYAIRLEFTAEGRQRWTDLTRTNVGKRLAFLVDGELLSAPEIRQPLTGGTAQLPGPFTSLDQARKVADAIQGN